MFVQIKRERNKERTAHLTFVVRKNADIKVLPKAEIVAIDSTVDRFRDFPSDNGH